MHMCPSHLRTMLPFLDSTGALSLERRGLDLVKTPMWSVTCRQPGHIPEETVRGARVRDNPCDKGVGYLVGHGLMRESPSRRMRWAGHSGARRMGVNRSREYLGGMSERRRVDGPLSEPGTGAAPVDATLGGYARTHSRSPAFEASDGHAYTVSVETERTDDLRQPVLGYLVFPRWARTGAGIVGHVESPVLGRGATAQSVTRELEALTLRHVQRLLNQAVKRAGQRDAQAPGRTGSEADPWTWSGEPPASP